MLIKFHDLANSSLLLLLVCISILKLSIREQKIRRQNFSVVYFKKAVSLYF